MTFNYKTNPLYIKLKEMLKEKYKHNFEDKEDFFHIYHKSMTFYIEPFDDTRPNTFSIIAGLNNIELYDGDTQAYNDEFQTPECLIQKDEHLNDFMYELDFLIKYCDAEKRCIKILKALDKINDLLHNNFDRDFLIEAFNKEFN